MRHWLKSNKIVYIFQRQLFCCVAVAFVLTSIFLINLQYNLSRRETYNLLYLNIQDVRADISDWSDENLLALAHEVADAFPGSDINTLAEEYHIAEINIIDENGIVVESTFQYFEGYDMHSGEQSAAFLVLLDGETGEYVQNYQATAFDPRIFRKYAGIALPEGGFVQVGYNAEQFQEDLAFEVKDATKNRHIGEKGYILIADENWMIVSDQQGDLGGNLSDTGIEIDTEQIPQDSRFSATVYGEKCTCMYESTEGYYIISVIPKSEAFFSRNLSIAVTIEIEIIIFGVLFILIYFLIRVLVVNNIYQINDSLSKITEGDLDVVLEKKPVEEFTTLSEDINATVDTLKHYITEAETRMDEELSFAEQVQYSSLPNVFPPYPERKDLDLFAAMYTAKEVGGDFYDFYFVGDDRLAFLIADVSGKGVPAAMFMMRAKTLLKSLTEASQDVGKAMTRANDMLCENNDACMFVTAWLGILDCKTGMLEYVSAGHNPPLILKKGDTFQYLRSKPGFVLAGLEGFVYETERMQLSSGDMIFLYTDGITEAENESEQFYGEERLLKLCRSNENASAEELSRAVKADVDAFVNGAQQFDDMTMLALRYLGREKTDRELTVDAAEENIEPVTDFVNRQLKDLGCPESLCTKADIAIDELFGNIAKYAYPSGKGTATIRVGKEEDPPSYVLTLIDQGIPYDPLSREDPDVTLGTEERGQGGLGIFLTKKLMDELSYEYRDGSNILQMKLYPDHEEKREN